MRLGLKLLVIGALLLVLVVPISLLQGLVWERKQRGEEVAADIARSSSRDQHLVGPLLLLEAEETVREEREIVSAAGRERVSEDRVRLRQQLVAPESLEIANLLSTRERQRGLFGTRVYTDALTVDAAFLLPPVPGGGPERIAWRLRSARLVLGLGDSRGIQRLTVHVDGAVQRVEPGTTLAWLAEGVHVPLVPEAMMPGHRLTLRVDGELLGTRSLGWSPLAGEARVQVEADWPHPGFQGERLPDDPEVREDGFRATWTVSRLSGQGLQRLAQCDAQSSGCAAIDGGFGVRLVDPVDRYLKTERAIKYALLFLVLVFGAVFFVEALRGVDVHPLQYGLTGVALAMFFLLLLSLAEHIGFGPAYALAAAACIALVTTYMQGVLGGRRRGLAFGALLTGLYGLLYGLLQSEDYALLAGSLALFILLAVVMLATRRLDWRRLGRSSAT